MECTHQNKAYYSPEVVSKSHLKIDGYCIDCGAPFKDSTDTKEESGVCTHPTVREVSNGVSVCMCCFVEMTEQLSFEPEWNRYSDSSGRSSKDPSRCHGQRNQTSKGLAAFFDEHNVQIDKARLARIEEKYKRITKQSDMGGMCRAGTIAACVFRDLRLMGETRTSDYVKGLFGLTKKQMSMGLTAYYECFPEESKDYITAADLIPWLMDIIGIDKEYKPMIIRLAERLAVNDPIFKRATPQSVASSIIYFFLCINPEYKKRLGMNKTKFAEKSELSDLTITKLVTVIAQKTKTQIDI